MAPSRPLRAALLSIVVLAGCSQPAPTCRQASECGADEECRDERCCLPWASRCVIPQQCCSGQCTDGRCVPVCRVGGLTCKGADECCSGSCGGNGYCAPDPDAGVCAGLERSCRSTECCYGVCRDDRCCFDRGMFCQASWYCCSGVCNKDLSPWACE